MAWRVSVAVGVLALSLAARAQAGALYVYKGAGCDGRKAIPQFENFLGRRVDGVVDFNDYRQDWPHAVDQARWAIGCWKGSGRKLAYSLGLAVEKGPNASLVEVAGGGGNAAFAEIARILVAGGFGDAYIRLGWEFNGSWYRWGAKSPQTFAAAFRQAHDAMSRVPGARFRFVWNPSLYAQHYPVADAYPGDRYVDVIASDVYNSSWRWGAVKANVANEPALWNHVYGDAWGVRDVVSFAARHGKPYAFPEWGTGSRPDGHGGGDDPAFIRWMAPWVSRSAFAGYWDYDAGDYNAQLSSGERPHAAAAFRSLFGAPKP